MALQGKNRLIISTAILALAAADATAAFAQDGKSEQAASSPEIVVTATRREQRLQDVPIAVTALGGEALQNAGIESTSDLPMKVPNLTISNQVSAFVVFLRGIGQLATNPGQEPSVATYVDGVYQPSAYSSLLTLANVQRVEVIKGPQGTLFGRNATGGLINVVTKDPTQELTGEMKASYGNFGTMKGAAYIAGGLSEGVAMDVSAYFSDEDHAKGRNVFTGRRFAGAEVFDIRSKLVANLGDTTKVTLAGNYTKSSSSVGNNLAVLGPSIGLDGVGQLPGFYDISADVEPYNKQKYWQISGRLDQDLGAFNLVSITAFSKVSAVEAEDADVSPIPILGFFGSQKGKVFSQELQLVSKPDSAIDWIVGAYYFNQKAVGAPGGIALRGFAFGNSFDDGINGRSRLKTKSFAGFAEVTVPVTDKFKLTAGGRYTSDKKSLHSELDVVSDGAVVATVPGAFGVNGETSKTFKKFTYRGIASYDFTDDVMGYVSYSRGFKSGGYDTAIANGIAFRPEVIDSIEAGLKSQFLDRRLTLNAAVFNYDYKDIQLPALLPGTGIQTTINASNAKITGFELDGNFMVTENVNIVFGLGYLDSKYKNFPGSPCTTLLPNGSVIPTPAGPGGINGICDLSGNRLIRTPKFTYNIGANAKIPVGGGNVSMSANYAYQAKIFFDVTNRLPQKAYGLLNGSIGWSNADDTLGVRLYGENLTNKKYTAAQYVQAGFPDRYQAGQPRRYGVELSFKFGAR